MRAVAWIALAASCACAGASAQTAYDSYDWGQSAVSKLYANPETAWVRGAGKSSTTAHPVARLHPSRRARAQAESGMAGSSADRYGAALGGTDARGSSAAGAETRSSAYGAAAGSKQTHIGSYSPGGTKSPYDSVRSFTP